MAIINRIDDRLFLTSKIARRIFAVFILCAILPLLTISAVSFFFAGYQLENQAEKRLRQQCKNMGLLIYERLITLEDDLKKIARNYVKDSVEPIELDPFNPITREGSGLKHLFLLYPDGRTASITELPNQPPLPIFKAPPKPEDDTTVIRLQRSNERYPQIFIFQNLAQGFPAKGLIGAEINPLYLWGIGVEGALPPEIEMSVIQGKSQILISSILDYNIDANFLAAQKQRSFSGRFENNQNGKKYINSYWSLFLKHRFSSPEWTIIFSQSKASIMAPVISFEFVFLLLILLTFWIILLFSFRAIRNRIIPIETLKSGALKIAQGEFGFHVDIKSGDEFESLAETFNEMSDKLKQSQAMILQAAKMSTFGQMGAGIVHEIGQPLNAIGGYTELLRMGAPPEKEQHFLSMVAREVERLKSIIFKFRTFTRVSKEVFTKIDINQVLYRTLELMDHQFKINRVIVEKNIEKSQPLIIGNDHGLQQLILNLLNNAIDALADNPDGQRKIRIRTYNKNAAIHVEIADNGPGIPEDIRQEIFDPFFTTKEEEKGTGLGLAISNSIVHKHKGEISVVSNPEEGTCFTLVFPIAQDETTVDEEPVEGGEE